MRTIGLLGVPTNSAGKIDGVARGPIVLRDEGLVDALHRHAKVHDYGDVTLPDPSPTRDSRSHVIDPDGLDALVARVRDAVAPIPGEAADMELGFALGMADASWSPELAALLPLVAPADVRILGPRDAGLLRAEGVPSLRDRVALVDGERLAADPARIAAAACASLPQPWWFHLDLDVLSTEALPAIDYPQPGGLGWDELVVVATTALRADPRGWDVTIYNPGLDPTRVHARRIVRFLGSVMGQVSDLEAV